MLNAHIESKDGLAGLRRQAAGRNEQGYADYKIDFDRTPLSYAAEGGNAVVRLLLVTGKVDVKSKDEYADAALLRR